MAEQNTQGIYEFGEFRADKSRRQLLRGSEVLPITSRAFDTLAALIADRGRTISKSQLMEAVWGDTAVEENNLTQQISLLRKTFGERAGDHRFIVTVPGKGYCFVAAVRENVIRSSPPTLIPRTPTRTRTRFGQSSAFGYGIAALYVLIVTVPVFWLHEMNERNGGRPRSVAVLQFRSSGIGDELLGMGIRDTLRAKLGSLEDVAVRPTTLDVSDGDVLEAGQRMDVDVVLTGSIQRDETRVRVAVEMVDVHGRRIVWGNTFDENLSNAFELQDSIAAEVVNALRRPRDRSSLMDLRGLRFVTQNSLWVQRNFG